jgi:hypothetical protein
MKRALVSFAVCMTVDAQFHSALVVSFFPLYLSPQPLLLHPLFFSPLFCFLPAPVFVGFRFR